MLWLLFIINSASFTLLFILNSIKEIFNLNIKSNKILNYILIVIIFIVPNFLFKNKFFESYNYMWIPFSVLAFIVLLSLITAIKLKRQIKLN